MWEAFGDVANYVEPFAGSLAVLLGRPTPERVETVNDLDCYLANFWRALQSAPDEVAHYADAPVNEADLHATHRWLVNGEDEASRLRRASAAALQALAEGDAQRAQDELRAALLEGRPLGKAFRERLRRDAAYFDAEVAGRWVWGLSQWIGSGWCAQPAWEGEGFGDKTAEHAKRPSLAQPGRGVHQLSARSEMQAARLRALRMQGGRPDLSSAGRGLHASGLWQQKPDLSGSRGAVGRGVLAVGARGTVLEWMRALAARLRYVRVCCGDWTRVLGPSCTTAVGLTAIFLDPPYAAEAGRDPSIYSEESLTVAHDVRKWALANGDNPRLRIALCGYEGEHELPASWRCVAWKAAGGYAAAAGNHANATRERIWFSPHCVGGRQGELSSLWRTA